jgi:type IV pilus assembly protein PilV
MYMKTLKRVRGARQGGFSLVEVMVALIICAVGLLGLAKMESLALASTGVASARALAAIQASSLASMMHANRDYWATTLAPPVTVVNAANNFNAAVDCTVGGTGAAPCTPQQMAFYDMKTWAASLNAILPGYTGTITCSTSASAVVSCAIQIAWAEKAVAMNSQQASVGDIESGGGLQNPTYVLYIEP